MRIKTIIIAGVLGYLLYQGGNWGREFYKIKMCEQCTQNLREIEEAKAKFRRDHPSELQANYTDLKPYMQGVGIPTCPWGGDYINVTNLDQEVTCSLNGKQEFEPATPGYPLKENGYMDLAPKAKVNTYTSYVYEQLLDTYNSWVGKEKERKVNDNDLFAPPKN
jgi:hypothetical protein